MELKIIHDINFDTDETILCASLINANEWVMLISSGQVIRYKASDRSSETLFTVKSKISYTDGGFDLSAPSSIYTLDPVIVVVNDFKRHGYISYPGYYRPIHLWREDYNADISRYPISLFKDKSGTPHLIYSDAWNHIQIMNLNTRRILTAAKSLITEHAEEEHISFYQRNKEDNKLPWPRPYDYFFGQLTMSPNNKLFLSKGWAWGSSDTYNVYDVADFITNSRISFTNIGYWEHLNRPACWIDDATVAVTYFPFNEADTDKVINKQTELHFYDISQNKPEITKRLYFEGFEDIFTELYYSNTFGAIIALHKEQGVIVCNMEGETLLKDRSFKPDSFFPELNLFLTVNNKTVCVHQFCA